MIAYITNIPTPSKNFLFNLLYKRMKGKIMFFFSSLKTKKRQSWDYCIKDIQFPYEIIESYTFEHYISKDPGIIKIPKKLPDFSKFKLVLISGGLNIMEFIIANKLLTLNIPYILHIESFNLKEGNSLFVPFRYLIRKFLFSNAKLVICASRMSVAHAKSLGAKNTILNYTSFDIYKFDYKKLHQGSFLNLLFIGRLIKRKRVLDILKALKDLTDYKLDIIGSGPLLEKLKNYVQRNNLNANFLGEISYEEMPEIYKNYDILILPSESEVYGYVVVEAIMSSLAVLVSNGVGAKDFVREDFHFKIGDIKALKNRILRLRDANLRNELVNYSRNLVLSNATPEIWVEKMIKVFNGL